MNSTIHTSNSWKGLRLTQVLVLLRPQRRTGDANVPAKIRWLEHAIHNPAVAMARSGRFTRHERKAGSEYDDKDKNQRQNLKFPEFGHSFSPPSMEEIPFTCQSDSNPTSNHRVIYIREHVEKQDALSEFNIRPTARSVKWFQKLMGILSNRRRFSPAPIN
jgi:hypothetical protein